MIDPNIEAALIGVAATIGLGLIGWAWRLQEKISSTRGELDQKVVNVREELAAYKLDVAEKYVSTQKLDDVENRMVRAVDELKRDLNRRLDDLLQTLRHPAA